MSTEKKKLVIGILGGIGSGKSTVAQILSDMGCAVIEADKIAHSVLQSEPVKAQIKKTFGPNTLDTAGNIDRKKLAARAFEKPELISMLNSAIHPAVFKETKKLIADYQQTDAKAIVIDMPLLAEVGWEKNCDTLIFIECSEQKRLKRITKKGTIDAEQVKKREKFQISLDKKTKMAQYIINNDADKAQLKIQTERIFSLLIKGSSNNCF